MEDGQGEVPRASKETYGLSVQSSNVRFVKKTTHNDLEGNELGYNLVNGCNCEQQTRHENTEGKLCRCGHTCTM